MDLSEYASCVPGPGAYSPNDLFSSPCFSFKGRPAPKKKFVGPSPTAYRTENYLATGKCSPSKSIGVRPRDNNRSMTPGPGSYNLEKYRQLGPSFSMRGKCSRGSEFKTPGPGEYNIQKILETGSNSRKTTMSGRYNVKKSSLSPGPAAYNLKPYFGKEGLSSSLSGRTRSCSVPQTPGPGSYSPSYIGNKSPSFTMSGRWKMRLKY